jgi:hypothetical protein
MPEWYRRLADVPGVAYTGSPRGVSSSLPGHDACPRVERLGLPGQEWESLAWPVGSDGSTRSPAARWSAQGNPDAPTPELLTRIEEVLELPGEPLDYHFALQGCIERLWLRRRTEPAVLDHLERLAWLDIALLEAQPAFMETKQNDRGYILVFAFQRLFRLYEPEGYLHEAREVAERAARFNQAPAAIDELRARIARLEFEDVG